MSPEVTAGVYTVLAIWVLAAIGILAVVLVKLYLRRRRGKVRCVVWDWELTFREAGPSGQAVFSFEGYLLNEGPLPTSLRSAQVVFTREGAREVVPVRLRDSASDEHLGVLNLPPCQEVYVSLYASFEGEEARKLSGFRQADFVARFPDDRTFRQKIAGREDFLAARKKVVASRKDFAGSLKKLAASRRDFVAGRKRAGANRKDYAGPRWRGPSGPRKMRPEHD